MQEAKDPSVPLLQRLRFLGIYSNNQDEFIKVRVANLIRYSSLSEKRQPKMTGGYSPAHLLSLVNDRVNTSQLEFRETYNSILSELEQQGVYVVNHTQINDQQREFCYEYFNSVVSVRMAPILLRKGVAMPFLPDGKIYLAVKMHSEKRTRHAVLQIPVSAASPRFVVLPSAEGRTDIIFLDDIIRLFLDDIFFMFPYTTISAYTFKIVRDAELTLDDDVSKSMTEKIFKGITKREHGRPVRLVYDSEMPSDLLSDIARKLGFRSIDQLQAGSRYHLMSHLMKFPRVAKELESKSPVPMEHPLIAPYESIIKVIKKQDILLAYPYHTFKHLLDFLREAAVDPMVHTISITLYRTAEHSKVITALLNAVNNGKKVTAMVELKARFDEEANIDSTELLQRGGVKVIHSDDTMKVHSKLILIERSEGSNPSKGYVYVGTGNFNENTAHIYSDFGLLTSDDIVADDARKIFDYLQNTHKHYSFKRLVVAPYDMRGYIEKLLETEIANARSGKKAYFYGKFNSLTDEKLIQLMYRASAAGVKIRLIVRSACCLKAEVEGLSENIKVRSIVDKFLEHARMIICCNGGKPLSYISSADIMTRNLNRRVEVGVPISNGKIHRTLVDYFNIQWSDNVKSRVIAAPYDNMYARSGDDPHRSQEELYDYFAQQQLNAAIENE